MDKLPETVVPPRKKLVVTVVLSGVLFFGVFAFREISALRENVIGIRETANNVSHIRARLDEWSERQPQSEMDEIKRQTENAQFEHAGWHYSIDLNLLVLRAFVFVVMGLSLSGLIWIWRK